MLLHAKGQRPREAAQGPAGLLRYSCRYTITGRLGVFLVTIGKCGEVRERFILVLYGTAILVPYIRTTEEFSTHYTPSPNGPCVVSMNRSKQMIQVQSPSLSEIKITHSTKRLRKPYNQARFF